MTIKRTSALVTASSVLALALSGVAHAQSVDMSQTGPDSNNSVSVSETNSSSVTNVNKVAIVNATSQSAYTGDADVSHNTTGGNATTGAASNNNSVTTAVTIGNQTSGTPGTGGAGGSTGGGTTGGGSVTPAGSGGASAAATGSGTTIGSGAAGMLPATGASGLVDVSALRNAVTRITAPTPEAVKQTSSLSTALLMGAALLSLLGAAGSAVYASKREKLA
jgi:hypothetical protein